MRVDVALSVTEPLRAGIVRVAEMRRDPADPTGPNVADGLLDAEVRTVRLRRRREVDDRLGEHDPTLRHPDELHRLRSGDGDAERLRVGHPDVLGRGDDDPPRDEARVLPRLDHAGEVVEGRIDVGASDRLDERGDDVVVLVALAVVAQEGAIDGGGDDLGGDQGKGRDVRLRRTRPAIRRGRGRSSRLERGERAPGVAGREPDDRRPRVGGRP